MTFVLPPYGRKESFNLVKEILLSDEYSAPVIVEIGMTRTVGNWLGDGYSTPFFAYLVNVRSGELYSIDADPDAGKLCTAILNEYGLNTERVHLIIEDSMLFLERWRNAVAKDIDVLYLDMWDYTEGPQAVISEEAHLKALQTVENALSPKALVLIDDVYDTVTFKGKGRLVIPYLLQKGYKPLHLGYQCLFAKDTEYTKEYIAACSSSSGIREDLVNELAQQAYDESVREGTIDLPENFGDLVLQKETEDEEVRMLMAKKREDNVLDADIRWWWNMDDIQRRMIVKIDQKNRGDELRKLVELYGFSEGEAGLVLRKTNPVYGEPGGEEGDDRPLPYELMGRITDYMKTLPAGGMNALKQFPSFNAFIREEFRKGSL